MALQPNTTYSVSFDVSDNNLLDLFSPLFYADYGDEILDIPADSQVITISGQEYYDNEVAQLQTLIDVFSIEAVLSPSINQQIWTSSVFDINPAIVADPSLANDPTVPLLVIKEQYASAGATIENMEQSFLADADGNQIILETPSDADLASGEKQYPIIFRDAINGDAVDFTQPLQAIQYDESGGTFNTEIRTTADPFAPILEAPPSIQNLDDIKAFVSAYADGGSNYYYNPQDQTIRSLIRYQIDNGDGTFTYQIDQYYVVVDGVDDITPDTTAPAVDFNDSIQFVESALEGATVSRITFDDAAGTETSAPEDLSAPFIENTADSFVEVDNYLSDVVAGDSTYFISRQQLVDAFVDTDGDAITLTENFFASAFDPATDTFVDQFLTYDAALDGWTVDTTVFSDAGFDSFNITQRVTGSPTGGFDPSVEGFDTVQLGFKVDITGGTPAISAGVEGEDYIYGGVQINDTNNNWGKRGFSEDGDYWVKVKNQTADPLIGDGQEIALVMGSNDVINGTNIQTEDILAGLADGSLISTKSWTSYDGIFNIASFDAADVDALVQSGDTLRITRVDATTGEQIGGSQLFDETLMYGGFTQNYNNSLSAQNDFNYAAVLEQQNAETGGF